MSRGYKFNEQGEMIPIDVYIVWGSPGSGKTTYVKEHMQEGDLVVDLDYIKQSISLSNRTECKDNLLDTAIKIRELLYDLIGKREVDTDNMWVIAGLPTMEEREQLVHRIKATEVVFIETTEKKCINRAMNDRDRKDKDTQIEVINKWFKQYNYE